jgi:hypothetical protein
MQEAGGALKQASAPPERVVDDRHVRGPPDVGEGQRERDALGERDERACTPAGGRHTLADVQPEAALQ